MTSRPALLIDLDDTLYPEEDYVRSGYCAVARHCAPGLGLDPEIMLDAMWYDFRRNGRTGLFDRLLARHPAITLSVRDMVSLYRDHTPRIALWADADAVLSRLQLEADIAIVTDGTPRMQRAKVNALGLDRRIGTIVYTWEIEAPKPSPGGFLEAARRLGRHVEDCIVVGDDPYHDIPAAIAGGFAAIRVRTGRASEIPNRDIPPRFAEIPRFGEIEAALPAVLAAAGPG